MKSEHDFFPQNDVSFRAWPKSRLFRFFIFHAQFFSLFFLLVSLNFDFNIFDDSMNISLQPFSERVDCLSP